MDSEILKGVTIFAAVGILPLLVSLSQNKKRNLSGQAAVVNTEPVEVRPTAEANAIKKSSK